MKKKKLNPRFSFCLSNSHGLGSRARISHRHAKKKKQQQNYIKISSQGRKKIGSPSASRERHPDPVTRYRTPHELAKKGNYIDSSLLVPRGLIGFFFARWHGTFGARSRISIYIYLLILFCVC